MATDKMKKKGERDVELPDEMLVEILSWLPAKSVCISRCCSKSFLNFTNSTNFALKQSQNSLLKDDSYFFIQNDLPSYRGDTLLGSSSSTSDQIPKEKVGVPPKFLRYVYENQVRILASSNGLLLCQTFWENGQRQRFICNPTTMLHSFIPSPITHGSDELNVNFIFSFEFNINDEDYKLYALYEDDYQSPGSVVCKMYIPKEGVWKEKEKRYFLEKKCHQRIINELTVFYKGAIHFTISRWCQQLLASYNVESGVSRIIELPDEAMVGYDEAMVRYEGEVGIFKWGAVGTNNESICLVSLKGNSRVGYAFTVWVLSDHETSSGGNWSKILSFSSEELGLYRFCYPVQGFTVMNGRSLIFATWSEVYDYDLSGKRDTRLEKVCDLHELNSDMIYRIIPYSDTLRSCGIASIKLGV